jgi:hypothetical protein
MHSGNWITQLYAWNSLRAEKKDKAMVQNVDRSVE